MGIVTVSIDRARTAVSSEDRARFEQLVNEHLDSLYGSALRLTRNRTTAEDLVQDTFLKAWRSFHTFQEGTNGRAWLYKILMNAYIDSYRRSSRAPEMVDHEDVGDFYLYAKAQESEQYRRDGDPEAVLLSTIMDADVKDALERVPEPFRAAVILADLEEFSYKEIAEILDIPIGTVMSRLYRGRRHLQRSLWDYAKRAGYVNGDETKLKPAR
jgi:RNA polymerase sigma-70 factor (ECF subfamily)